ncbi:UPF0481 protein [Gossypium australe]|uniref:UPF0481 protein n=1 Tax=Gossypium australe TaxID=47621 RepID=A0A5B6VUD7_9ROSI|nr:UPF0481 protein [Gossypium australe]
MLYEDGLILMLYNEEIIIPNDEHLLGLVHDNWIPRHRPRQLQPQPKSESDPSHIIETSGLEETKSQTSRRKSEEVSNS